MDLISNKTLELTSMALDGLSERHKVITSNIANAQTSNYQRADVRFEDQLVSFLSKENMKEQVKLANSTSTNTGFMGMVVNYNSIASLGNISADAIVSTNNSKAFKPEIYADQESPEISNGNNVNIEKEMVELNKNGTKYTILAELQGKMFKKIEDTIRGVTV